MARERTSVGVGDVVCTFALTMKPHQKTLSHRKLVRGIQERLGVSCTDAERGVRLAVTFAMLTPRGQQYRLV